MNMHIFDNIGCNFSLSDKDFIIGSPIPGYKTLNSNHVNAYIPYLARNIDGNNISWEVGVGFVYQENNTIYVRREQVKSSSNNDRQVDFTKNGNKQFYLFINSSNFNTGFNNVFIKNEDFTIENIKAVYIVDVSSGLVNCTLPLPQKVANLGVEFRTVGGEGSLVLKDPSGFSAILAGSDRYTSLISTGSEWIELKDFEVSKKSYRVINNNNELQSLSSQNMQFNILSDPSGDDRSLQFNDNGIFDGTSIYWGTNEQLLLGSSSSGLAKSIIPTSGNLPLIINNTKNNSDFIVYGSGNGDKNIFFTYDGKLGINIPTGVRPQTILHIINSYCQESLRVENRSTCYPADVNIYHRPPVDVADNSIIGRVKLSSKNKAGNKIDYVQLTGKAKSTSTGSTKGQFDLVVNSAATGVTTISTNPDNTTIGYSGSAISIGPANISGIVGSSSMILSPNNISINSPTVSVSGTLSANNINVNNALIMPNIESNTLLAINNNKQLAPATGFKLSGVKANKILSSNSSGTIVGSLDLNTFLVSYEDIVWNKFPYDLATGCLRQLTFTSSSGVPAEHFGVGDQIAIMPPSGSTIFRIVDEIEYSASNPSIILSLLLDQKLVTDISESNVYSISKGGYILNQLNPGSGAISDATAIILSTRPNKDTEFNTKKKNINFKIYGVEDAPAFGVIANASFRPVNSGIYFGFATQVQTGDGIDIDPFPVQINAAGQGQSPSNNSINFSYASLPFWSGMISTVGSNGRRSFYGTYDQNGNAFEWVEDSEVESNSVMQKICGGSWRTTTLNGLRSIIDTPYDSHLDDIGFRICSRYGLNDPDVDSKLNLSFVPVANLDNITDTLDVFTENSENRFEVNAQPEPTAILNLGKSYNPYRIGKYEVTNGQYSIFLNAIAKTDVYSVYHSGMSISDVGGIVRSGTNGSYQYLTKANMEDKPVVFVDYLSSIRFTNWLHNGAPTGTGENSPSAYVTEDGAYSINIAGSTTIVKNRDQKYWLPNLNEWHKAAYFKPITTEELSRSAAITVRRPFPYEVSSGIAASISVSGHLYADNLIIGNSGELISSSITNNSVSTIGLATGKPTGIIYLGPDNAVVIDDEASQWYGNYRSKISNTGIVLACSGDMTLVSTNPVRVSGIRTNSILTEELSFIDANGNLIQGGLFPGPNGGFLFKNLKNNNTASSAFLKNVEAEFDVTDPDTGEVTQSTGVFPSLSNAENKQPIYKNSKGYLEGYQFIRFGETPSGLSEEAVVISAPPGADTGVISPALVVDKIRIGPALPSFSGSVLTHNGEGLAKWDTASYLKAEGMSWNRYPKRALELISLNSAKFFGNRPQTIGGTGPVGPADILTEFGIDETIAITNASKQVVYAKVASFVLLDSDQLVDNDFFTNEETLLVTFCPPVSQEYFDGSTVDDATGTLLVEGAGNGDGEGKKTIKLAYMHSVQKGGYLDMGLDQSAVSGFNCDGLSPTSKYRFKPSTANTISIRPKTHTSFNKVAEDIDFAIYGYKDTIYNRYEPEIFGTGVDGLPTGLNPAFYVNVNVDNSAVGSVDSGVAISGYLDVENTLATGITLDESAKITINTKYPYIISSITPTSGYNTSGTLVSGINPFTTYADVTVNSYLFSSGIISNDFSYNPQLVGPDKRYIPNAPLTINSIGQLVSLVPPPPATIPGAPTAVVGLEGNQSVTLSWTAPTNNGGRIISNYIIEYSDDDGNNWVVFERPITTEQSAIISGLVNGISYKFRVSAVNEIGIGPVSEISGFISPTSDSPGQPLNLIVTRGFLQALLSWSAPITSGSSNIVDYRIEYAKIPDPYSDTLEWITFPDGIGTATSITITGILNGPTYVFRVAAQNSSGIGVPTPPVKSVGTDPEPTPPSTDKEEVISDNWDFGEIVFTGVCL